MAPRKRHQCSFHQMRRPVCIVPAPGVQFIQSWKPCRIVSIAQCATWSININAVTEENLCSHKSCFRCNITYKGKGSEKSFFQDPVLNSGPQPPTHPYGLGPFRKLTSFPNFHEKIKCLDRMVKDTIYT